MNSMPPTNVRWHLAQGSHRGESHAEGEPGGDAALTLGAGELTALVVSDGAGSALFPHLGSREAARSFIEAVQRLVWDGAAVIDPGVPAMVAARVHRAVVDHAMGWECFPRDLACTLVAAVLTPHGGWALQLGDGACVVRHAGQYHTMIEPDHGEFINQTCFLTDDDWDQRLRWTPLPADLEAIYLVTDGLQDLVLQYPDRTPHSVFFDRVTQAVQQPEADAWLAAMLASEAVARRTDDDRSIAVAVRQREPGA